MITESTEFHAMANRPATDSRYRRLLESAPDGIIEVDGHGSIVLLNSQAERLSDTSARNSWARPWSS